MEQGAYTPLQGKVCIVTGAGSGIGKCVSQTFAGSGAAVIAVVHREAEWIAEWNASGNNEIIPYIGDVCDSAFVRQLVADVKARFGRLDALVNVAGIVTYEMLAMVSKDTMRQMFEVNVFAVIELMQYASRVMQRQKSGSIVNIASVVGAQGAAGQLSYSASKGAVIAATKSAAKELAPYGVRVNAVAPGMIATERLSAVAAAKFPQRVEQIRMGRMGTPCEVADACLFFASDASVYVTGQILGVDGSFNP